MYLGGGHGDLSIMCALNQAANYRQVLVLAAQTHIYPDTNHRLTIR